MKRRNLVKKTLLPALVAAICSVLALTTVSYAWFTMGNTARVESIDVNVVAADGMQMSADASSWKSIINVSELAEGYKDDDDVNIDKNNLPGENFQSYPVSSAGNVVNGFQEMFLGEILEDGSLKTTKEEEGHNSGANFIAFDLFVNLASAKTLKLDAGSSVVVVTPEGEEVKNVDYAVRVSFIYLGTTDTAEEVKGLFINNFVDFNEAAAEDYAVGQWVKYEGKLYECKVATKLSPDADVTVDNWTEVEVTEFNPETTYAVGDMVSYQSVVYKCLEGFTGTGAWDSTKWEAVSVNSAPVAETEYNVGEYLEVEEQLYVCKVATKLLPADDKEIDNWEEITNQAVIWEPNASLHTTSSGASGALEYYGVNRESEGFDYTDKDSDELSKVTTIKPEQYVDDLEETAEVVEVAQETKEAAELFEVAAGFSKIRVYIWLEGQDIDCANDVSDSQYKVNLKFLAE